MGSDLKKSIWTWHDLEDHCEGHGQVHLGCPPRNPITFGWKTLFCTFSWYIFLVGLKSDTLYKDKSSKILIRIYF